MTNRVEVELRPHIGQTYSQKLETTINVEHDQWIVMASVNGGRMTQVGYIGKADGAPLNGIDTMRSFPKDLQEQVLDAVLVKLGRKEAALFVPDAPDPALYDDDEED